MGVPHSSMAAADRASIPDGMRYLRPCGLRVRAPAIAVSPPSCDDGTQAVDGTLVRSDYGPVHRGDVLCNCVMPSRCGTVSFAWGNSGGTEW